MLKHNLANEIYLCGTDPLYFIEKYAKIQHPTKGLVSFTLYDFQKEVLQDFLDNRFNIINKARQLGISTLIAAYAAWLMMFSREKNILVIATKIASAKNIITKVKVILKYLPKDLYLAKMTTDNKFSIELSNGSKIQASSTARDAGRSEACSLLIIDEAAHVDNLEDLWMGLYPTISTGGRCILASTPNGTGNKFHQIYTESRDGSNEFVGRTLHWSKHPERDETWFMRETRNMPRKQIAQEYEAEFIASGDTFIEPADINRLAENICEPIAREGFDRNLWVWEYPIPGEDYIIGADIARGDGYDWSALQCIKVTSFEVVAEYRGKLPPDAYGILLDKIGRKYNNALLAPENNTFAYSTIIKLRELNYPNLFVEGSRKIGMINTSLEIVMENGKLPGFETNGKTRPLILAKLEEVIRNKDLIVHSERFVNELKTFRWKKTRRPEADRHYFDDLVMSMAIACYLKESTLSINARARDINCALLDSISMTNRKWDDAEGTGKNIRPQFAKPGSLIGYTPEEFKVRAANGEEIDISWLIQAG